MSSRKQRGFQSLRQGDPLSASLKSARAGAAVRQPKPFSRRSIEGGTVLRRPCSSTRPRQSNIDQGAPLAGLSRGGPNVVKAGSLCNTVVVTGVG